MRLEGLGHAQARAALQAVVPAELQYAARQHHGVHRLALRRAGHPHRPFGLCRGRRVNVDDDHIGHHLRGQVLAPYGAGHHHRKTTHRTQMGGQEFLHERLARDQQHRLAGARRRSGSRVLQFRGCL